jgi:hypothetical protein
MLSVGGAGRKNEGRRKEARGYIQIQSKGASIVGTLYSLNGANHVGTLIHRGGVGAMDPSA